MSIWGKHESTAEAIAQVLCKEHLTTNEAQRATELTMDLIRQAEVDLRQALAERLALETKVPVEIIIFLANDEIAVAESVLCKSPVLSEHDLSYIIAGKDGPYWRAIARRTSISTAIADKLVNTGDTSTMRSLLDNKDVVLSKGSMKKIIGASVVDESLQAPIMQRPEMDATLATTLYTCVGHALKSEIARRFPLEAEAIEEALEDLVAEFSRSAAGLHEPTPEMAALSSRFHERNGITADLMIRTLRRGQVGFFVSLFSARTGLKAQDALRLMRKDSGHAFALACRAIGISKAEFASLFMLAGDVRGQRVTSPEILAKTLTYYEALREFDVQRVMTSWIRNPSLI